jgi:hypothetical protein
MRPYDLFFVPPSLHRYFVYSIHSIGFSNFLHYYLALNAGPNAIITVIAGNNGTYVGDGGLGTSATLYTPQGVTVDKVGNVYFCELHKGRVRKIAAKTGTLLPYLYHSIFI